MKELRKILKYIAAVSISGLIILFILSIVFDKKISGIFTRELNKKLKSEIQIADVNFSLLRKFPRASLELDKVLLRSPVPEGNNIFPDTLLYAEKLFFTLKLKGIFKNNYTIDRIDINRGNINVYKGPSGKLNTDIWNKTPGPDTSVMKLNINTVNINNSSFSYIDEGNKFIIRGIINNSSNKLVINEGLTEIRTRAGISLSGLETGPEYQLSGPYSINLNTGIRISPDSIVIGHSVIDINDMRLVAACDIGIASRRLSLQLATDKAPISTLASVLPAKVNDFVMAYDIKGKVSATGRMQAYLDKSSPLLLLVSMDFENAALNIPSRDISLADIKAAGTLKMDLRKQNRYIEVFTDKADARINGTPFSGSLFLKSLRETGIDIVLSGLFPAEQITDIIDIDGLKSHGGSIRLNARLHGSIPRGSQDRGRDILQMKRSLNVAFNGLSLEIPGLKGEISDLHGNMMIADKAWADGLSMKYNGQNIALNGMVSGLNQWLLKEDNLLEITAGLWSDRLDLSLFTDSLAEKDTSGRIRDTRLKLNLSLLCDSLIIGNFRASLFEGNLSRMPGIIDVTSFSMNALGGSLSGNAAVAELNEGSYATRGWFEIENIDIKNTFTVFNNFRQDYIKSDNLGGVINGSISLSATADREFKINRKDLVLNGEYEILNGRLVNFEPAYKLSRFVEMEELERIVFSKLENELIINNEMITIPRMDISSSAFNISMEGNHSFSGNYEYHLKVLLSDLLSKKENARVSEYGVVEDDGLGRTSLYLKIIGDKQGSRVSHDTDALRMGIKEDLQREKQNIKSILKEEYGWYAADSLSVSEKEVPRRFRIVWEETDSIRTQAADTSEKKLPLFRLFKKKNLNETESEKK